MPTRDTKETAAELQPLRMAMGFQARVQACKYEPGSGETCTCDPGLLVKQINALIASQRSEAVREALDRVRKYANGYQITTPDGKFDLVHSIEGWRLDEIEAYLTNQAEEGNPE